MNLGIVCGLKVMAAIPALVTPDEIAAAVRDERHRLADWLATLTDQQWRTQSLCTAWTVRDVLAHLTSTTRQTVPAVAREAVKARGSFDRMVVNVAAARAARYSTSDLLGQLHRSAESTRRFPGSSPLDPLMDLVVHAQDIARPAGQAYSSPVRLVTASLGHVVRNPFMGAPRRVRGLRLVSTDSSWTHGSGVQVQGSELDLLLAASGRPDGLRGLTGPGVALLHGRLGAA